MRYNRINRLVKKSARSRAISGLMRLREQLDGSIPRKDMGENLLLATWNIREFGRANPKGYGSRMGESLFYIAEVISRFDFVAVQEVSGLDAWGKGMKILGPDWDYICTDVTDRKLGGNGERLTYVYDTRKVRFRNVAGEIVLPADMLISRVELQSEGKKIDAGKQFHRTPFFASFQSGWLRFDICTVHIYYGSASGDKLRERIEEIDIIARYLSSRADQALKNSTALILLGDFNIVHPEHRTMEALLRNGFQVPRTLQEPTNLDASKFYDQIAFKTMPQVLNYVDQHVGGTGVQTKNAGVFDLFSDVLTNDMFEAYRNEAASCTVGRRADSEAELEKVYGQWRTFQLSDHKPMWVRLNTNDSADYLERLFRRCVGN